MLVKVRPRDLALGALQRAPNGTTHSHFHKEPRQLPRAAFPSPGLERCTFWSPEKETSLATSLRPWIDEVLNFLPKLMCSRMRSSTLLHLSWYPSLELRIAATNWTSASLFYHLPRPVPSCTFTEPTERAKVFTLHPGLTPNVAIVEKMVWVS